MRSLRSSESRPSEHPDMPVDTPNGIVLPKRVFIDSGHLIELSGPTSSDDSRCVAYGRLKQLIRDGAVLPVVGFGQPFEWVRNSAREGHEIAAVLDSAVACFECIDLTDAFVLEVLAEAVRTVHALLPPLPPALKPLLGPDTLIEFYAQFDQKLAALAGWFPGLRPRRFASVHSLVDTVAKAARHDPSRVSEMRNLSMAFEQTRESMKLERHQARRAIMERIRRNDQLPVILGQLTPPVALEAILRHLDLARCPTLSLWSTFWWRMVSNQRKPDQNDPTDLAMLPAYVYADLSLTERRMCSHVRAADPRLTQTVFSTPEDLVACITTGTRVLLADSP